MPLLQKKKLNVLEMYALISFFLLKPETVCAIRMCPESERE